MIDERFVLGKVDALFSHFAKERGGLSTPVDPVQFADSCGVLNIEYRHMIPEAVLTAVEGGFVFICKTTSSCQTATRRESVLASPMSLPTLFSMTGIRKCRSQ